MYLKKTIVLAGGSGFLGMSLADELLKRGYDIAILSRSPGNSRKGITYVRWDGETPGEWQQIVDGSEAVVNFTGRSVNCLYTRKNREEIMNSRIRSVQVMSEAILACKQPPRVLVQAGSLAIYGDTREECAEDAPHGTGFSVEVCEKWEEQFYATELPHTRKVLLRIGFALGRNGGALEPLAKLAKIGLGGKIGSGEQYISWIHKDDLNEMFVRSIEDDSIIGTYNATGPSPVTNRTFMAALRQALNKGWAPPAPAPFVALGAVTVMRASPSLALTGRNCIPKRFEEAGFRFAWNRLDDALKDLLS